VAKLRERISVSKEKFDLVRFDLRKLHDVEVKERYQLEISFAALESSGEGFDINNAWESIRENIKILVNDNLGHHRRKHNKLWFCDEC
jgi:hypothetical protein